MVHGSYSNTSYYELLTMIHELQTNFLHKLDIKLEQKANSTLIFVQHNH